MDTCKLATTSRTMTGLWLCFAGMAHAMVPLSDNSLAEVAGQNGVSLVIDGATWSASSIEHTQDGESLRLKGVSARPVQGHAGVTTVRIDTLANGVHMSLSAPQTEYRIDDIVLGTGLQGFGGLRSFANVNAAVGIRSLTPSINASLEPAGLASDLGFALSGSVQVGQGTAYWRHGPYDLITKGLRLGVTFADATFKWPDTASGQDFNLTFQDVAITAGMSGMTLDLAEGDPTPGQMATPLMQDERDPRASRSFGQASLAMTASGALAVSSGGRLNQGLRLRPDVTWRNTVLSYQDEGVVRAAQSSGQLVSASGITLDLEKDAAGTYLQLATSDVRLRTQTGSLLVGGESRQQLGNAGVDLHFMDGVNGHNAVQLRPGGDPLAGMQGVSVDVNWHLAQGSAFLTDNDKHLWIQGLRSHGSGNITLDMTRRCSTGVVTCFDGSVSDPSTGQYNGHFDGLRVGFNDVVGSYSLEGIRFGSSPSPLEGETELKLFAGIYDATLNGHATLLPGGKAGDGLRFNADLWTSNFDLTPASDAQGEGIWLSDTHSRMHFRHGSVDVTEAGLEIHKGEHWSRLDINDARLGSRAAGKSFGRIMFKTYELDSSITLATGGSGTVCAGALAGSAGDCTSAGGTWQDFGDQGLSARLKTIFVQDNSPQSLVNGVVMNEKRNQFAFETNRRLGSDGKAVNGSGAQMVLDNFWTSDDKVGDPLANQHGLQVDVGIDIAPTVVVSKVAPHTPSQALGFAINGRLSFKEMGAERLQALHPTGGAQTVIHGLRMQNADVRFNLTATPIN